MVKSKGIIKKGSGWIWANGRTRFFFFFFFFRLAHGWLDLMERCCFSFDLFTKRKDLMDRWWSADDAFLADDAKRCHSDIHPRPTPGGGCTRIPKFYYLPTSSFSFFFFFSLDVTIGLRIYSQSVPQIVGFAITKLHKNVMEISCRLLYRCQKDEGEKNKIPEEMHLSGGFFFKHFSFYEIDTDRLRVWTLDSEGGRW